MERFDPYYYYYEMPRKNDYLKSTLITTQKSLVLLKEVIPLIYSILPMIENMKTTINVAKALKQVNFDEEIDEAINHGQMFKNML